VTNVVLFVISYELAYIASKRAIETMVR
jgi:hypothetical protein